MCGPTHRSINGLAEPPHLYRLGRANTPTSRGCVFLCKSPRGTLSRPLTLSPGLFDTHKIGALEALTRITCHRRKPITSGPRTVCVYRLLCHTSGPLVSYFALRQSYINPTIAHPLTPNMSWPNTHAWPSSTASWAVDDLRQSQRSILNSNNPRAEPGTDREERRFGPDSISIHTMGYQRWLLCSASILMGSLY